MSKVYRPKWKEFKKVWGAETWLCNTPLYCGKLLHLEKGYRCSAHYHQKKDEVFYILTGKVLMEVGTNIYEMNEGDAVRIEPGVLHRFTGLTDAIIIEISTQHFEDDSYRLTNSEKVTWVKKQIIDRWRKILM